ncbi:hypothetical protein IWW50_005868 [Coemansia erecta]|nr:hypothetical protein GGF43_005421 [Coemansia sp. RSA 2618]KAJ2818277.1 hypothetical protein IWW50_005868 [Coemansia erecta]
MPTREQMLAEDTPTTPESPPQLQDNLKYFLNPKELQTPITPVNPSENPNVQALRNRRVEAENQVSSAEIAQMLRDVRASGPQSEAAGRLGAKYGLDRATVLTLNKYLDPADK